MTRVAMLVTPGALRHHHSCGALIHLDHRRATARGVGHSWGSRAREALAGMPVWPTEQAPRKPL